jgi:hypothetical protein
MFYLFRFSCVSCRKTTSNRNVGSDEINIRYIGPIYNVSFSINCLKYSYEVVYLLYCHFSSFCLFTFLLPFVLPLAFDDCRCFYGYKYVYFYFY